MADVAEIVTRTDKLKADRANFENHWQQVSDYILPAREFTTASSPGAKRDTKIFNTTPVLMCEQLAGGLHGMLTSPALRWFALRPTDRDVLKDDEALAWFADATDRLYEHFNSSTAGFDTSAHEVYLDEAAFGIGVMYIPDLGKNGPGYRAIPLAECYVSEGPDGRVDTLHRRWWETARNVLRLWPDTTPEKVRELAEKTPDQKVEVIHAVYPAKDRKRWHSVYVLVADKAQLEEGHYKSFPYVVPRWTKRSGEVYGTGAAMNALPDVKLLNFMERETLRALQLAVRPPLMAPDDGFLTPINTAPGAINIYRAGMVGENDRIMPMQTGAAPAAGWQSIDMIQKRIEAVFYTRWMNLPIQPNMTATEVIQRRDEMLRLLGPMVSRLQQEFLGPLIERSFRIMLENGLFAPLPPALAGANWTVEYLSPLAISQKISDADNVLRWFQAVAQMAQVDPEVVDAVDADEAARFLGSRYNVPPTLLRSLQVIQQRRDQRAQAQEQAANMAAADTASRVAKTGAQAMGELAAAGQPAAAPQPAAA